MKNIKLLSLVSVLGISMCLVGCSSNNTVSTNTESNSENTTEKEVKSNSKKEYRFESENIPTTIEFDNSIAELKNTKIVSSPTHGVLLVMDFKYTNNSENPKNFINDSNCKARVFQNGIELDEPGITSEQGVYDSSEAFTSLKDGGTVDTQLVWKLQDTIHPIEVDFGNDKDYNPVYIGTITIKDGDKYTLKKDETIDLKSDYDVKWEEDIPNKVETETSIAEIGKMAVKKSDKYGDLLIIEFSYTNNSDSSKNLINDFNVKPIVYQNGKQLDSPGVTSEQGLYSCSDSFTSVKNGGKITTQLVWVLDDTQNKIEVNFGEDGNYKPYFIGHIVFQ